MKSAVLNLIIYNFVIHNKMHDFGRRTRPLPNGNIFSAMTQTIPSISD